MRVGWVAFAVALLAGTAPFFVAQAYTFLGDPAYAWPPGKVTMLLKLGSAGRTLIDGNTSWDTIADQTLKTWNSVLAPIQLSSVTKSPGIGTDGDRVNQVFFNSTVYGQFFGGGVLAVTTSWFVGTTTAEADVTFNSAVSWDSYSGPLRYLNGRLVCDFRRVALHEFGHVIGLDHPERMGQTVSAIMNSVVSDLESLTLDDISGAQVLYPQAPGIPVQPSTQTAAAGNSVTITVTATGSLPLSYQWYRNDSPIPGGTNATCTISRVDPADAGDYQVRVSNPAGSALSAVATLTVEYAPVITVQPRSQKVPVGANVPLSITADAVPTPVYQWYVNGIPISGANRPTYTIANSQAANAGDYYVSVSNTMGSVESETALLTVDAPPAITNPPQGQTVAVGQSVSLNVTASGTPPLSYLWYFNDSLMPAATNAILNLSNISTNQAGEYSVRVANDQGIASSEAVRLEVVAAHPFSNGSFESATVQAVVGVLALTNSDTRLLAWSIGGTGAQLAWFDGKSSLVDFDPIDGTHQVTFNTDSEVSDTTLFQNFDTGVGQDYEVSFYVGGLGATAGNVSLIASVLSGAGQPLASLVATPPAHGYGQLQRLLFTAVSATSTLVFKDTSTEASIVALDNVSVSPSVLRARIELGSEIAVCWESFSDRVYQVQWQSDLSANAWTDLGSPVPGNGSTVRVVDNGGGQLQKFYRVIRLR